MLLTQAPFHQLQLNINEEGNKLIFKKAFSFLFAFIIAGTRPVVKLFDVEDNRTAFPCDFTKAFGFALVLSFLSHQ